SQVAFASRAAEGTLFLTSRGAVLSLGQSAHRSFEIQVAGARTRQPIGQQPLAGTVNRFRGQDRRKGRNQVPAFGRGLYPPGSPGVDLVFYGNRRTLEYDLVVHPEARAKDVELTFKGVDRLALTASGNLELALGEARVVQARPRVYQEVDGKQVEI